MGKQETPRGDTIGNRWAWAGLEEWLIAEQRYTGNIETLEPNKETQTMTVVVENHNYKQWNCILQTN